MTAINETTTQDTNAVYTPYSGTASMVSGNYTFATEQNGMTFNNSGDVAITLTINSVDYPVPARSTLQVDDIDFSTFDVVTASGESAFELTAFVRKVNLGNLADMVLNASATWDVGSLVDGAGETSAAITVTGAAFGDFVLVSAPVDLQGLICAGYVSAANTVNIRVQNETGLTVDLATGTWKVKVIKS